MTTATWTDHGHYIQCDSNYCADSPVYGYARVSTLKQKLDQQITALMNAGCFRIFKEKKSTRLKRPIFESLWEECTATGSILKVWRIDRLGRSVAQLANTADHFLKRGATIQSLCEAIDIRTSTGRLTFNIAASIAQHERDLISERTIAGLAVAKANGKDLGTRSEIVEEVLLGFLECIWTKDRRMTNKRIVRLNDYGSTSILQNHFQGERKRMREARDKGPAEFEKIKKQRLREFAKAEGVPIRVLNKICKQKQKEFAADLIEREVLH